MKLDKDFKDSVKTETAEGSFIFWAIARKCIIPILAIVIFCGAIGIGVNYFGTNAERAIFKQSVTYNEEAAQFLAKSYREYNEAENSKEENSIKNYVTVCYPNLDVGKIENHELKNFYMMCVGG